MISMADAIATVCARTHVPMAQDVFGAAGVEAAFQIMRAVRELYMHVEPERVTGTILIYRVVGTSDDVAVVSAEPAVDFSLLANRSFENLVLEVDRNGTPHLRRGCPGRCWI